MKRILVFSDTHGNINSCMDVINVIKADLIIHLGDLVKDALDLEYCYPDIPVKYVGGNNDYYINTPTERVVEFYGVRLFCTHGHCYSLRLGYKSLVDKAKQEDCTFALFGHTHEGLYENQDGIILLNPGSLTLPRDGRFSYGVIEIDHNYAKGCICEI